MQGARAISQERLNAAVDVARGACVHAGAGFPMPYEITPGLIGPGVFCIFIRPALDAMSMPGISVPWNRPAQSRIRVTAS